jgi:general secretion pathway protein A
VKLDSSQLRQLKQRISIRAHLGPLTLEETKEYIEHRLRVAGSESKAETIFPGATVEAVYHHSRGIPRLINTICENALIIGYARQMQSIGPDIIHDVAREFRLETSMSPPDSENGTAGREEKAQSLRDLYAMLRGPGSSGAGGTVPLVEASEYEPNI